MAKAKRKGLKLESYFEQKESDDVSTDDIIPEVIKPAAIRSRKVHLQ